MQQRFQSAFFAVLLVQMAACSLDFDRFADRGENGDAGSEGDGGAKLGDPCNDDGAHACDGHASRHTLVCRNATWQAGSNCAQNERCDTRGGSTEGDCVRVPAECSDRSAGGRFCAGETLRECGADLVTFEDVACGDFGACEMAGSVAKCTCQAGHAHIANGSCSDVADDAGLDAGNDAGDGSSDGDGDDGDEPKPRKNKPPEVEVVFPPPGITQTSSITVRGRVTDPEDDAITKLTVNGKSAKIKNDGSFSVKVPIALGTHALELHVEDERGAEDDSEGSEIERLVYYFESASDMLLDAENERVIALDSATDAIVAISLEDGERTLIVEPSETPVGRNSLELDAAHHRVLVTEANPGAIAWIDLNNGKRTPILEDTPIVPHTAVLDPVVSGRAFIAALGTASGNDSDVLYTVDLASGNATPFAISGTGLTNFGAARDLVYDEPRNRLIMANREGLVGISVTNGAAQYIATSTRLPYVGRGVALSGPNRLALDGDRLLMLTRERIGSDLPCVLEMNLVDGVIHELAALGLGDDAAPSGLDAESRAFAFDAESGDALVLDLWGRLVQARLQPGDAAFISNALYGEGDLFDEPVSVTDDLMHNRWVVADADLEALIAVSKATGDRSVLSDDSSSGIDFDGLVAVGYDETNDALIALDRETLYRVDPISGARTVIASDVAGGVVGTGPSFAGATDLYVAGNGTVAHVVGCYETYPCNDSKLISIDLADGTRELLSGTGKGSGPLDMFTLVADGRGYLVISQNDDTGVAKLLRVDPSTGNRTIVADADTGAGPGLANVTALAYDAYEDRAIIVSRESDQPTNLLGVDLISGDRTLLAEPYIEIDGKSIYSFYDALVDPITHRVVAVEGGGANTAGLFSVLTADQKRTLISDQARGDWPVIVTALDSEVGVLYAGQYVTNRYDLSLGASIVALDLHTQERTVVSDDSDYGASVLWQAPFALALDQDNDRVLGLNFPFYTPNALVAVDLGDGTQSVLSDATTGTGTTWQLPGDVAWDSEHERALLNFPTLPAIVQVDADGNRKFLSGGGTGEGPAFTQLGSFAIDSERDRMLVVGDQVIFTVDLTSGDRELFAEVGDDNGPDVTNARRIVIDEVGERAIVLQVENDETTEPALIAIDLEDGTRSVLVTLPRAWYPVDGPPASLSFDGTTEIAYVGSLYAVDTTTGDYVLIAGVGH